MPRTALGPRFRSLLASSGAANLGDGVVQVALPLVALSLTRSPTQIALLTALAWLPWSALGIPAGVLVDRTDRRTVQVLALTARAALLAAATWLAATGSLTMPRLLAVALAYGVTEVLADLAARALVPDLVPRPALPVANGRIVAVQQVANSFLGAPLTGVLLMLGTAWAFGVPAGLAVLAAAVLVLGVRGTYRHTAPTGPADVGAVPPVGSASAAPVDRTGAEPLTPRSHAVARAWSDVRDGLTFVARHRVLRPVVAAGALINMASTGYFVVFVLWAVGDGSRVGLTEQTYPLLMTALAVGAVAGSVLTPRLLRTLGDVRLMVGSFLVAFGLLTVPVLAPHPAAVGVTLLLVGALSTTGNVVSESLRQRVVPPHLLGRVTGAGSTLTYGLMPVGALLAGVGAEHTGQAPTMLGATVLAVVVTATLGLALRHVTTQDLSAPPTRDRDDVLVP